MRIAVVGAGVVGATTALALVERGYEVTLIDANDAAGTQASAVNAGMLVPGDSTVWGNPAAVRMLVGSALPGRHSFIKVRFRAGWRLIPWGIRFLLQCFPSAERRNVRATHRLSVYSYDELEKVVAKHPIEFSHDRNGMIFLFGSAGDRDHGLRARGLLAEAGEEFRSFDSDELTELDPGFAAAAKDGAVGLYSTSSGHGDSEAFARGAADAAAAAGATLRYGTRVRRLVRNRNAVRGVETDSGERIHADLVILAAGSRSAPLARDAGLSLPIIPGKGYSATVPITDPGAVPRIGGVDERAHVAFSVMQDSLRISSTAEFAGEDMSAQQADYADIRRTADRLFPNALDWSNAVFNTGARPATPSGVPIIGLTHVPGLAVNSGHGHLGWTQACGSATLLADLISGRTPAIDPTPYQP